MFSFANAYDFLAKQDEFLSALVKFLIFNYCTDLQRLLQFFGLWYYVFDHFSMNY